MTFTTTGHGHVTPRSDGCKARCGGPALCVVCQCEAAQQLAEAKRPLDERVAGEIMDRRFPPPQ